MHFYIIIETVGRVLEIYAFLRRLWVDGGLLDFFDSEFNFIESTDHVQTEADRRIDHRPGGKLNSDKKGTIHRHFWVGVGQEQGASQFAAIFIIFCFLGRCS